MPRPIFTAALCLSSALPALGASASDPASEFWLARLRQAYRTQTVAEDVIITVSQAMAREKEIIAYRAQPLDGFREPEILVDLGELEVWTRPPGDAEEGPGLVRAAHELDYRSYFEAEPSGETTLETLRASVPPLVLPQLALTLGGELFPMIGEITWTGSSEERAMGAPPEVTLRGESERATVELTIEGDDTPRVLGVRIVASPGPVTITLRCEPAEIEGGRLGYDVTRRDRLPALADLRERSGDRRAGDPLPDLPLVHYTLDLEERLTEAYLQRMLLFFDGSETVGGTLPPNASIGIEALRAAREAVGPTTRLDAIGVLDPTATDGRHIQVVELDLDKAIDPDPAFYTYSERRTLRRFVAESDEAIVIAAKDGAIAGVIDLGDASDRAKTEGRDAVVADLASRVEELCRLIARRARGLD